MSDFVKSAFNFFGSSNSSKSDDSIVGQTLCVNKLYYKVKRLIAEGGYGAVYEAIDSKTQKPIAIKRIISHSKNTVLQEIEILKKLKGHPNIVNFVSAGTMTSERNRTIGTDYIIITELCKNGQLTAYLPPFHSAEPFSLKTILQITHQCSRALQHMHALSPPISHRDMKIENLLLSDSFTIKLCDFGSASCETFTPDASWSSTQRGLTQDKLELVTTPMYRAPEMIDLYQNYPINQAVDIWALGCVLFMLVTTYHPFEDSSKLAILSAKYTLPDTLSPDHALLSNLIRAFI